MGGLRRVRGYAYYMAPLISLTQLKTALGNPNPSAPDPKDATYTSALNAASALIRNYTGLKFEVATLPISSARKFEYDGSGFLDIDEAQKITNVTTQAGFSGATITTMTSDEWSAYPLSFPVKLWLRLADLPYGGISPEMGFTYNLDTLAYRMPMKPQIVTVTGIWGWPEIPADVQQATIWTALSIAETPRVYTQESIENYSRTRGGAVDAEPIPERAQAALMPYIIPQM